MTNRLTIFAGYDGNCILHDYTLHYIKELSKHSDVIAVFDNMLNNDDRSKLEKYTLATIAESHGEYDFGSYKRGLEFIPLQELEKYNTLTLCNDSVFGPLYDLKPVHKIFETDDNCDFWGLFKITKATPHIQSFYICFKNHVFTSKIFTTFISSITKQECKEDIVHKYEMGLSKILHESGYKSKGLFYSTKYSARNDDALNLIGDGFPFIKKVLFSINAESLTYCNHICKWKETVDNTHYDSQLIIKYLNKQSNTEHYDRLMRVSNFRQFLSRGKKNKRKYLINREFHHNTSLPYTTQTDR